MTGVKLSDCCTILSGGTPDKGKLDYWGGTIPWFSPKDIKTFDLTNSQDSITEVAARDSATRIVEPSAILVVSRSGILAHSLPVGVLRQRSAFNQDIKALIPKDGYDPDFLAHWLQANQARVIEGGVKRGPTVHSLVADYLEKLVVPQLPIEKQRELVARLRSQLAKFDIARQAASAQADDIALLRRRVLAEVFAAVKDAPRKRLGDHAPTTSGSTPPRGVKAYWAPAEVPWVKTGEVAFAPIARTEESVSRRALAECSLTLLPRGSVLVAMYGQGKTRGQSAILKVAATTNQACFAILPNETWEPSFLFCWLMSSYRELRNLSEGRGGNQANLSGALLNALEVPAPSRTQQVAIARRAQGALREVAALAERNLAQRLELERLPQHLLAQAFEN